MALWPTPAAASPSPSATCHRIHLVSLDVVGVTPFAVDDLRLVVGGTCKEGVQVHDVFAKLFLERSQEIGRGIAAATRDIAAATRPSGLSLVPRCTSCFVAVFELKTCGMCRIDVIQPMVRRMCVLLRSVSDSVPYRCIGPCTRNTRVLQSSSKIHSASDVRQASVVFFSFASSVHSHTRSGGSALDFQHPLIALSGLVGR